MEHSVPVGTPSSRFLMLDALRGIAALAVVFQHLYANLSINVEDWFPVSAHVVFTHGYLGVPVFFVISGFVITHSVDCQKISPGYTGRFALRRAVRLDPPYWFTIAVSLLLLNLKACSVGLSSNEVWPDKNNILAHLFYAQDLLHYKPLSAVYWTLCLEIQLYLAYILFSGIALWLTRICKVNYNYIYFTVHVVVGLYSAAAYSQLVPTGIHGLFIQYYHFFLLGVLSYMVFVDQKFSPLLFLFLGYEALILLVSDTNANVVAGCMTAALCYSAIKLRKLQTGFNFRPVQYLGSISYSLYIIHADIGWKAISVGKRFLPYKINVPGFLLLFAAGLSVSLFAAHLLWKFIERPSNQLSKMLKRAV
ncbi:acyltransferase family protein [Geomonas anaerohicana]|uniref:Acyltransferase n=1 Tax=Geomonas anaerohicana TaxID=2798583 RepID=A0ABS0YCG2_9BACT|nr:acyltransferase [Geomonas anaerohicana]MBJ6749819.1 acyltransferase [Geomonas anaerohicana]